MAIMHNLFPVPGFHFGGGGGGGGGGQEGSLAPPWKLAAPPLESNHHPYM